MSDHLPTFIEDCVSGRAVPGDIEAYVERWHEKAESGPDLASFLGMDDDEYERWVRDPDSIKGIVSSHRRDVHPAE